VRSFHDEEMVSKQGTELSFQKGQRAQDNVGGNLRPRLWTFVPIHMHFRVDGSMTGPPIHSEIEMGNIHDRNVSVGGRKNRSRFAVELGEQSAAWSRGQREVGFLTGLWTFAGHHSAINVDAISAFQINTSIGPHLAGCDFESVIAGRCRFLGGRAGSLRKHQPGEQGQRRCPGNDGNALHTWTPGRAAVYRSNWMD